MGALTDDARSTGLTSHIAAATPWVVGLSTTTPTSTAGNITEPTGNNYARAEISWGSVDVTGGVASVLNDADIEFPVATGSWGTIVAAVIYDDNGTPLHWFAVDSESVALGDRVIIEEGNLGIAYT